MPGDASKSGRLSADRDKFAAMAHTDRLPGVARGTRRVTAPQLIAATTGLVFLTVLLGVATKATGAGLACNARWPLCDGGLLNLFPATVPSFFEWIHRVVAGVTGFAILGSAVVARRQGVPTGARRAVTLGLVLLPVQVLLGRETVLQYTAPILAAHFWVAFTIFACFAGAAALTWRTSLGPRRLRAATLAAAALVPAQVLLHPPVVTSYTPTVQTLQYAVTLAAFALVLAVALAGPRHLPGRRGRALAALVLVHPPLVYAGRHLFAPSASLLAGYAVLAVALVGGLLAAAVAFHRAGGD